MMSGVAGMAMLALAACSAIRAAPQGDVVAVVDGIEITSAVIDADARAAGLSLAGADAAKNRDLLVKRAVERALLVAEANRRDLARQPAFLAERVVAENNLLADRAIAALVDQDPVVEDAAVQHFIAENPQMFAARRALHVHQIGFRAGALAPASLDDAKTMDAVIAALTERQVAFDRSDPLIDSATLPKDLAAQLAALRPGEPAHRTIGDTTYVTVVLEATPVPHSLSEQQDRARRTLAARERQWQVDKAVAGLRRQARIAYQEGFAPR
ncbi:EpsD family peptidyl-prolyl cis-trans isomerase [Sphingomonas zeicaulis]|uniref:hypothetical protein n=1 Tax=Sphingomonas zeicaulis TaxID=1632740 RepID=UPI003D1CB4ED